MQIDERVVETEECDHGVRVIDLLDRQHLRGPSDARLAILRVQRADETDERRFSRRQIHARQNAFNLFESQVFRGDRRVRAQSEETAILFGRERREQLALARS